MKVVTKSFICGVSCFPGADNCNNYCNHYRDRSMPDRPGTYQSLVMQEIDMWKDVIEICAGYVPGEKTIFEILQEKYSIQQITKQ